MRWIKNFAALAQTPAREAALELEQILGERITDGVVIDVRHHESPRRIRFYLGDLLFFGGRLSRYWSYRRQCF